MVPSRLAALAVRTTVWTLVSGTAIVFASQVLGWKGNSVLAAAQSLTPYMVLALAPTALVALCSRSYAAGLAAGATGLAGLAVVAPIVFAGGGASADERSAGLTVASVNLLYTNERVDDIAVVLAERAAQLIAFSEYTAEHHHTLDRSPLRERYPYRIAAPGPGAEGVALWSQFPLSERSGPATVNNNVDAVVAGPDGDVRILSVHTPTPIYDFDPWVQDLATIADAVEHSDEPMLLVGDLNASYWHPGFRDLLDRGFRDAHVDAGAGFSVSWPAGGSVPAFVRLDHALTGHGLVSTSVDDFELPGSDHTGFAVSVAPAR